MTTDHIDALLKDTRDYQERARKKGEAAKPTKEQLRSVVDTCTAGIDHSRKDVAVRTEALMAAKVEIAPLVAEVQKANNALASQKGKIEGLEYQLEQARRRLQTNSVERQWALSELHVEPDGPIGDPHANVPGYQEAALALRAEQRKGLGMKDDE